MASNRNTVSCIPISAKEVPDKIVNLSIDLLEQRKVVAEPVVLSPPVNDALHPFERSDNCACLFERLTLLNGENSTFALREGAIQRGQKSLLRGCTRTDDARLDLDAQKVETVIQGDSAFGGLLWRKLHPKVA